MDKTKRIASWPWNRCTARRERHRFQNYWGRCDLRRGHDGLHLLERGMDELWWSTDEVLPGGGGA